MSEELYKKHRPTKLEQIYGQKAVKDTLKQWISKGEIPHTILLSGPSGTGKTTIAMILRDILECGKMDYREIDCAAVDKPLETVKELRRNMSLSPISGKVRIFFLEEIQAWSKAGFSQQALLRMLEQTPRHVYFILATTDPNKLIKTIHSRATELRFTALSQAHILALLKDIVQKESLKIEDDTLEEIAMVADGGARKAIVLLEQVAKLPLDQQTEAVTQTNPDKDAAINLCRVLINPRANWKEVATILKQLTEDPETIRYTVLGYARGVLLGGGPLAPRAFVIIDVFSSNFYDSKTAGLAAACWECCNPGK